VSPADAQSPQALAERFGLPAAAAAQLQALLTILLEDEHAPISARDHAAVLRDHLADSLSGLELPLFRAARPTDTAIADIGSGAGLPGLPLAIALPEARVALVESNGRKCAFIEGAAAACGLTNTEVVRARAEDWPAGIGRFDVVTARALARLDVVAEYAAPLLKIGGSLVAWRGRRDPADEAAGAVAAGKLGLEQGDPIAVTPYRGAQYRHLHVLRKIAETPPGFPRRPGVARKRPLGGPGGRDDFIRDEG
jgi:16S rRNA (guanine527-N7)-methyltransferase